MKDPIMNQEREAVARLEQYASWLENVAPASPYLNIGGQGKIADIRLLLALRSGDEGWQLVPVEPTREMWAAMGNALVGYKQRHHDAVAEELWKAVLAASPSTHGEG